MLYLHLNIIVSEILLSWYSGTQWCTMFICNITILLLFTVKEHVYLPILKLGSRISAAANFKHHNCHQQEECRHCKADSIYRQVSHKAGTVVRNMFTEARNFFQLVNNTRGKHHSRQDSSQKEKDCVDNSWCSGVLTWGTSGTATKTGRWSTTTGGLRKVIEHNNELHKKHSESLISQVLAPFSH